MSGLQTKLVIDMCLRKRATGQEWCYLLYPPKKPFVVHGRGWFNRMYKSYADILAAFGKENDSE